MSQIDAAVYSPAVLRLRDQPWAASTRTVTIVKPVLPACLLQEAREPAAAVALHFMPVNFALPHKSLAKRHQRTPATAAGIADHVWTCEEIAALLD